MSRSFVSVDGSKFLVELIEPDRKRYKRYICRIIKIIKDAKNEYQGFFKEGRMYSFFKNEFYSEEYELE